METTVNEIKGSAFTGTYSVVNKIIRGALIWGDSS